jgi:hypothetical protein
MESSTPDTISCSATDVGCRGIEMPAYGREALKCLEILPRGLQRLNEDICGGETRLARTRPHVPIPMAAQANAERPPAHDTTAAPRQPEPSDGKTASSDQSHPPRCPFCGSTDVEPMGLFGSQLLTEQHYCRACRTPFERVKGEA